MEAAYGGVYLHTCLHVYNNIHMTIMRSCREVMCMHCTAVLGFFAERFSQKN